MSDMPLHGLFYRKICFILSDNTVKHNECSIYDSRMILVLSNPFGIYDGDMLLGSNFQL